jgi:hypothetical protein
MFEEDTLQFIASEYCATGEGLTICILITKAYPETKDYEEETQNKSYMDNNKVFHFVMPALKKDSTPQSRAMREFVELYDWYAKGAEFFTREKFITKFYQYLPEYITKCLRGPDDAGNFNYQFKFHVNYS